MTFDQLHANNSTIVKVEGVEYRTIEKPTVSSSGDTYTAVAVDQEDNQYLIEWAVVDPEAIDEVDACDWDEPIFVQKK
ncbi:hypothetical protein [Alkalicoccus urumqiensis]|uniref:Uncharacterized protein n=1 Tax=Alkalicoccus urumqiensis TaxID=1548213 RepID=A0A2P6MEX2_ALKUR|nr:hypothetical protein [Alkalicoccus urumqiensis]PRO64791.1 hypothetical protein C6I21_12845 [Alkalicoccus urumqiensis]